VHGDDYLATIGVAPFLVTSLSTYLPKVVPAQDPNDILGTANRKALAHLSATSSTFAPAGNVTGAGSNQRSSASLAFRTASSSVSPAEAHPGNSGKNAAQRLVWGSCSTTSRSFIEEKNTAARLSRQTANERRAIRVHSCGFVVKGLRRASNEGHCALSAMLTVSQLSKSFAGRALFDDVSLQVNRGDRIKFQS
jgi:hypothetical protein